MSEIDDSVEFLSLKDAVSKIGEIVWDVRDDVKAIREVVEDMPRFVQFTIGMLVLFAVLMVLMWSCNR